MAKGRGGTSAPFAPISKPRSPIPHPPRAITPALRGDAPSRAAAGGTDHVPPIPHTRSPSTPAPPPTPPTIGLDGSCRRAIPSASRKVTSDTQSRVRWGYHESVGGQPPHRPIATCKASDQSKPVGPNIGRQTMSSDGPGWSQAQQIDQAARPIFEKAMLKWAIPSVLTPDIGIDYSVELLSKHPERNTPSGDGDFLVQLKGESDATYSGEVLSQSFDTDKLRYILNNKRRPVFLVVVDINTERGYWKFLQQFAAEEIAQDKLLNQKSVTIPIPITQNLEDLSAFRIAIRNADQWLSNRWPGTPQAAVNELKRQLEAKDPRIEVDVKADAVTTHIAVRPKTALAFSLVVQGPRDAIRRFHEDAINRGLQVNPENYGVTVSGSDLPCADSSQNISSLHISHKVAGHAVLAPILNLESGLGPQLTLHGDFQGGTRECRFRAKLPSGVLSMDLSLEIPETSRPVDVTVHFRFDTGAWKGKPIARLPDFGILDKLFQHFSKDTRVSIQLFLDGNVFFSGPLPCSAIDGFVNMAAGIDLFRAVRRLTYPQIGNLMFPGKISQEDLNSLIVLEELQKGTPLALNSEPVTFEQSRDEQSVARIPPENVPSHVVITLTGEQVILFGHAIPLGTTQRECKRATFKLLSCKPDPANPGAQLLSWSVEPQIPWLLSRVNAGQAASSEHQIVSFHPCSERSSAEHNRGSRA